MTDGSNDNQRLAEHLDKALDHILAVRARLGMDEVPELPAEALDAALGQDDRAREARHDFRRTLDDLRVADDEDALFAIEEAANRLAAAALDVGFTVGWTAGRGGR